MPTRYTLFGKIKDGPWFHHGDYPTMDAARSARETIADDRPELHLAATKIKPYDLPEDYVWTPDDVEAAIREIFRGR